MNAKQRRQLHQQQKLSAKIQKTKQLPFTLPFSSSVLDIDERFIDKTTESLDVDYRQADAIANNKWSVNKNIQKHVCRILVQTN